MVKTETFSFLHEGELFEAEIEYYLPKSIVKVRHQLFDITYPVRLGLVSKQKLVEMLATNILLMEKGEPVLDLSSFGRKDFA